MIRLSPQFRAAVQRIGLPALILLSAAVIVVGKADQTVLEPLRVRVADAVAPLLDGVSRPLSAIGGVIDQARGLLTLHSENARLRQENERLLRWQQTAMKLASENAQLRGLLRLAPEAAVSYVTARVIANSGGAYARSLLVNAGTDSGIARGQAAMTGEGLVGRVSEVATRASRILLITDLNSRIPVIIESSHERSLLMGDNSERPRLQYLSPTATVRIGDRVVTSGHGGIFPPGLPVGLVAALEGGVPRVEPFAELSQVAYLRVIDYGLAGALPAPVPVVPRAGRSGKAGPAAEPELR